ncbi:MAG: hypothetical protein QW719_03605 [Candidatus Micrarchaeaceae archaeon]
MASTLAIFILLYPIFAAFISKFGLDVPLGTAIKEAYKLWLGVLLTFFALLFLILASFRTIGDSNIALLIFTIMYWGIFIFRTFIKAGETDIFPELLKR